MPMTTEMRSTMARVRGAIARLQGPHGPIVTTRDRLEFMRRHMQEIDRSARLGLPPADVHLIALAAHALVWHSENATNDG